MTKFGENVTEFFKTVISENVEFRQKHHVKRPDMITLLMEARNEMKHSENIEEKGDFNFLISEIHTGTSSKKLDLSVEDITANAMVFFFAGFSTTTSLLCFMTYELAVNHDVQKILLEEIDTFRKKKKKISYQDLSEFPYMHMVFSGKLNNCFQFCDCKMHTYKKA